MPLNLDQARHAMIEQQIRPWEVLDSRVLTAFAEVKREDYVPLRYRKLAYADLPLPLEHGEVMMKPVVEGRLLEALDLASTDEVLEIGTGSGYLTACLAWLARAVVSIDRHPDFVSDARARLAAANFSNVHFEVADVFAYEPGRRFDAIAVTGAVTTIPMRFREWLKPGGRLFVLRGRQPAMEAVLMTCVDGNEWREESLFETELPYLRGAEPAEHFVL